MMLRDLTADETRELWAMLTRGALDTGTYIRWLMRPRWWHRLGIIRIRRIERYIRVQADIVDLYGEMWQSV